MKRPAAILAILALVLCAAVALRLGLGPSGFAWPEGESAWRLRVERTIAGVVVGGALALGGVFLQALLRNPLASPDLIGPASGAGFAVALAAYLTHAAGVMPSGSVTVTVNSGAALIGSLAALGLVYALSQRRGSVDPVQLVLVGVIVSIMFSAGTMFVMYLMPDRGLSLSRWTIGALSDDAPRPALIVGLGLVGAAAAAGSFLGPTLDAASLSDDEAASVGVNLPGLRIGLFAGAGALTAAAVVLAGPVGFVGLVSPHLVRVLAGPGHGTVIAGSALCGATIIVGADAATRALDLGAGRMPIGIITAILGGVTFIGMIRGGERRDGWFPR